MIWRHVEYTAREDELQRVLEVVATFVGAVTENEPETLYHAWQDEKSPLRFVHLMGFPDGEAEDRHRTAPYTKTFVEELYPRCSHEPDFRSLKPVAGS